MAEKDKGKEAALVVGAGGVGALIYALLAKKEGVVPPGEVVFHLDDETRQALAATLTILAEISGKLSEISTKLETVGAGALPNKPALMTGQKNVTTAGTAVQLPDVRIPDGFKVVVMAKPGNSGYIYLGNSKVSAEDSSSYFDRLEAGDSITLQITTLKLVWCNSSVSGDGITYIVEQA